MKRNVNTQANDEKANSRQVQISASTVVTPTKSTKYKNPIPSSKNLAFALLVATTGFLVLTVIIPDQILHYLDNDEKEDHTWEYAGQKKKKQQIKNSRLRPFFQQSKNETPSSALGVASGRNLNKINFRIADNSNPRNTQRGRGSKYGLVQCDQDISSLVSYWSDPRSDEDRAFRSPFLGEPSSETKYLSFEPDCGGWNNIRMEFENMIVLAAATGRTLILPSDHPLYLLQKDKVQRHRGLQTFFQYTAPSNNPNNDSDSGNSSGFDDIVPTIRMQDFFQHEILERKSYSLPDDALNRTKVLAALEKCDLRRKSSISCFALYDYLADVAEYVPDWYGEDVCLIFDEDYFQSDGGIDVRVVGEDKDAEKQARIREFCNGRTPFYYNQRIHEARLLHFKTSSKYTRILVHFYAFMFFTNPKVSNYYKRLVRDRVRYADKIFCAGGKIVKALAANSGHPRRKDTGNVSTSGNLLEPRAYSSMHIRRGDFQWKRMRISAEEWYQNTRHLFSPGELIYISTDETNRTFFEPLSKHYELRFLSDFEEAAGLDAIDPNFAGMVDQVVASRGRIFVGTYFSSFSAYIGRMRGYHGMSGRLMWYGQLTYANQTHNWVYPHTSYSAREFPIGWVGIDGDTEPTAKDFY